MNLDSYEKTAMEYEKELEYVELDPAEQLAKEIEEVKNKCVKLFGSPDSRKYNGVVFSMGPDKFDIPYRYFHLIAQWYNVEMVKVSYGFLEIFIRFGKTYLDKVDEMQEKINATYMEMKYLEVCKNMEENKGHKDIIRL